ncbi:MAG: putative immunity protein [Chloroflexota bacterium]
MGKAKLADTSIDKLNKSINELVNKTDHNTAAIWAIDCAERVLPYFEKTYPEDNRPRKAIEAGRAWVRSELKMTEARKAAFASHAAARDANQVAEARCAARAAGHAAATAHVASHAVYAAAYAVTAVRAATDSADADIATAQERDWQYQHLLGLRATIQNRTIDPMS